MEMHARTPSTTSLMQHLFFLNVQEACNGACFGIFPLLGRSYPLQVEPGPTHPRSSTATGVGLFTAVAGIESFFTVPHQRLFGLFVLEEWMSLKLRIF
jgi:hypothetical protein